MFNRTCSHNIIHPIAGLSPPMARANSIFEHARTNIYRSRTRERKLICVRHCYWYTTGGCPNLVVDSLNEWFCSAIIATAGTWTARDYQQCAYSMRKSAAWCNITDRFPHIWRRKGRKFNKNIFFIIIYF